MPQRKKRAGRCDGCGLHLALCLCAELPRVHASTPIVVVQHVRERFKPTNTGRLLQRMVEGVAITHFGMREPPFDATPLQRDDVRFAVLFPRDDATEISAASLAAMRADLAPGQRLGFVLLDGTWHQCSRMSRRVPVVDGLPCVSLPPGPPSRWAARTQHDVRGLSTFEAGARLLGLVDGEAIGRPLRDAFLRLSARLSFMKGATSTPDVPPSWFDDPLVTLASEPSSDP